MIDFEGGSGTKVPPPLSYLPDAKTTFERNALFIYFFRGSMFKVKLQGLILNENSRIGHEVIHLLILSTSNWIRLFKNKKEGGYSQSTY